MKNVLRDEIHGQSAYCGHDQLVVMAQARHYNQMIEQLLLENLSGCHHLIDIGAGLGDFSLKMRQHGHEVLSIEPDDQQRRTASSLGLRCMASIEQCHPESYDGAFSLNVLEHIEDDVAALQAWGEALKPQGLLFIYVPAFPALYSAMDRAVGHYRRYTKASLKSALQKSGYTVLESAYADSLGFLASLALKVKGGSGALSPRMVRLYDQLLFPLSRRLDFFLDQRVGKNVWAIARKEVNHG